MLEQIYEIVKFILNNLWHIWPYLVITIPLAVAVKLSGAAKYIRMALTKKPVISILLATIVGAFSPFCSCGVIPIIAALLMGGVPLAPVMSFWLASPSMDPEIFFLSVSTIGWQLALWRLGATFALSLIAGYITHYVVKKNLLSQPVLKSYNSSSLKTTWTLLKDGVLKIKKLLEHTNARIALVNLPVRNYDKIYHVSPHQPGKSIKKDEPTTRPLQTSKKRSSCGCAANHSTPTFKQKLLKESYLATVMVAKFMILAFFLEAVITLYVPSDWIIALLGQNNPFAILIAALIGVPIYTSNLAALGMIGGLLNQGMSSAAALAFLIAGPTTTIPAMAAVWNLVSRKIFLLYVSFTLTGAVFFGYFYYMITSLI
jgi:uncharacterized membrane protein YraQ (UPF0718 family)